MELLNSNNLKKKILDKYAKSKYHTNWVKLKKYNSNGKIKIYPKEIELLIEETLVSKLI